MDLEAITNTVNCVGVMGKGLALEFKRRYPSMFQEYVTRCADGRMKTGQVWLYRVDTMGLNPQYIVNFPTKRDWRNPSRIEWIEAGLKNLRFMLNVAGITSIGVPALGCTNGGLNFDDVFPLIQTVLDIPDVDVYVFPPQ